MLKVINFFKKNVLLICLLFIVLFSFQKTIISGLLPIPSDTIVGLYYPFRDLYAKTNPNGVPYKNFLITDPVRQIFPWKSQVIESFKKNELPLWNPYNFSGTPLLANFQSGSFYPFNLLFFLLPFENAWTFLIILQPLFAGLFMFLFLSNLRLKKEASFLGAISFSFGGFATAWMEWGNIIHTTLWLPLILLSIDNLVSKEKKKPGNIWILILVFSLISSFFAGHLQFFVYSLFLSIAYFIFRWVEHGKNIKTLRNFGIALLAFVGITAIQWLPTLKFISLSGRAVDQNPFTTEGWFIPWQHLVQFVIPDFFGNPTTLNYWGVWNYGEFIGYIGILPIMAATVAIFWIHNRTSRFFSFAALIALIFALHNPIAKIPFILHIPFFDSAQPTRLIFIVDFALSVLASLGLDFIITHKKKKTVLVSIGLIFLIGILWGLIALNGLGLITPENLQVVRSNLLLPTFVAVIVLIILTSYLYIHKGKIVLKYQGILILILLIVTSLDLLRFFWKFEPFTSKKDLFPSTPVTSFLKENAGVYRTMSTDSQIVPPNFSPMYNIQTPDGYDPLYLRRYAELVAAYSREKPDISPPFGFNRIITLQNMNPRLVDFLGIKYVLTFKDDDFYAGAGFERVYKDGKVRIYENKQVLPRAFFVFYTKVASSREAAIKELFDEQYPLIDQAVVENVDESQIFDKKWTKGSAEIKTYSANKIVIETKNTGDGFLVLSDSYYPSWHAKIDGKETKIYLTNYAFRGIIVPTGTHKIEFSISLF